MHPLLRFLFIITLSTSSGFAQDSLSNKLSFQIGMTRMDFFTGVHYARKMHAYQPLAAIELGINRTFFQSRIFPKVSIGGSYFVIDKQKFVFGPSLSFSYSLLKVNLSSSYLHQWNELYGGLHFEVGSKIRFSSNLSAGWMNERYFNQVTQRKSGVNSLGFNFNFGVLYAW